MNPTTISEDMILTLADAMAASACTFNTGQQGYDVFICAREQFHDAVKLLFTKNATQSVSS
jgi:hypothetical protein